MPSLYWIGNDIKDEETLRSLSKDLGTEFFSLNNSNDYFSLTLNEGICLINQLGNDLNDYFDHPKGRALPTIILTDENEDLNLVRLIRLGAYYVLQKPLRQESIVEALQDTLKIAEDWFRSFQFISAGNHLIRNLTPREHQIFRLLIHGNTNKTIAENLGISARTVEVHRSHIMSKLQTKSLFDLIILSIATGEVRDWRLESIQFAPK